MFLPNSTFSLNGDMFVNMNITCPFNSPAKKGDVINEKLASLLGKLDIKPIEAGLAKNSAPGLEVEVNKFVSFVKGGQ